MSTHRKIGAAFAALLLTAIGTIAAAQQPATTTSHASTATHPRVDVMAAGKVVVSLDMSGDLPGILTLNLQQQPDGSVTGDWALVVAYADARDPATGDEPSHEETVGHPHKDFLTLVRRGTLGGSITSGSLAFAADGSLADLTAALAIDVGSVEFDGASGTGSATLADLSLVF
ncbi:MAG: hypothetical protein ABI665_15740 [Vicinamibacterales bacterium]